MKLDEEANPPGTNNPRTPAENQSSQETVSSLLVDRREAAVLVAASGATWDRMTSAGKPPTPIRLSRGCIRWKRRDLERWIESGCPDRRTFQRVIERKAW